MTSGLKHLQGKKPRASPKAWQSAGSWGVWMGTTSLDRAWARTVMTTWNLQAATWALKQTHSLPAVAIPTQHHAGHHPSDDDAKKWTVSRTTQHTSALSFYQIQQDDYRNNCCYVLVAAAYLPTPGTGVCIFLAPQADSPPQPFLPFHGIPPTHTHYHALTQHTQPTGKLRSWPEWCTKRLRWQLRSSCLSFGYPTEGNQLQQFIKNWDTSPLH